MRARGAMVTDIAILVVAADDGIMPQTVESINHAKAAEIPIIVAINKMDKPDCQPRARHSRQLTEYGLVPEEWGGDTIVCIPVSAKTGMGIDNLLETDRAGGRGAGAEGQPQPRAPRVPLSRPVWTRAAAPWPPCWCRTAPCMQGDVIIAGTAVGRVRAMTQRQGQQLNDAGPSVPVEITGLTEVPAAGDTVQRRGRRASGP